MTARKKKLTHAGPTCSQKNCGRAGGFWRKLNWWCASHRPDDAKVDLHCNHPSSMHHGGVETCSWCTSTLACDWPKGEVA